MFYFHLQLDGHKPKYAHPALCHISNIIAKSLLFETCLLMLDILPSPTVIWSDLYPTWLYIKPHVQQAYGEHIHNPRSSYLVLEWLVYSRISIWPHSCHDPQIKFCQTAPRVCFTLSVPPKKSTIELMWLNVIPASLPEPKLL